MNRILFVILAVLLILSIFAGGCGIRTVKELAPIDDVDIWADNSSPRQYLAYVVSGESDGCHKFDSYNVTRVGDTFRVEIFNLVSIGEPCPEIYSYVEHAIPLGSDFVPDVNYTVEVNDVTVTFIVGNITVYLAPIHNIDIWPQYSSPTQYFVGVVSGEPSVCDHLDSYNVTRAGDTTIIIEIFNRRCCTGYPEEYSYAENTIPIGSDFIAGVSYTVAVNNVTETFVA